MQPPRMALLAVLYAGLMPGTRAFGNLPDLGNLPTFGHGEGEDEAWCAASPPQLCMEPCKHIKACRATQCAMRTDSCCAYTCQAAAQDGSCSAGLVSVNHQYDRPGKETCDCVPPSDPCRTTMGPTGEHCLLAPTCGSQTAAKPTVQPTPQMPMCAAQKNCGGCRAKTGCYWCNQKGRGASHHHRTHYTFWVLSGSFGARVPGVTRAK